MSTLGWGHGLSLGVVPRDGGLGSLLDVGPLQSCEAPHSEAPWAGFHALLLLPTNSEYILNMAHTLTLHLVP